MRSLLRVFTQQPLAAKVPEVTVLFWVIKISTTAAGEGISDWLANTSRVLGFFVEVILFCTALYLQFRSRRYSAVCYWYLALAIATSGTGVADTMHLLLGLPYAVTTVFWLVVLASSSSPGIARSTRLISTASRPTGASGSTGPPCSPRFTLGTAVGDLFATTFGLGFLGSALLFCGVILIPWIGWRFLRFNAIFAFWFAYVITRPLGASFADYLSKSKELSGADFGDIQTAAVLTGIVAILVAYTAKARYDIQPDAEVI